jgi:hypothetical protein
MPFDISSDEQAHEMLTPGWQYAVASGILGWVLDAFDFFVVIFLVDTLAANFHVEKKAIVWRALSSSVHSPTVSGAAVH